MRYRGDGSVGVHWEETRCAVGLAKDVQTTTTLSSFSPSRRTHNAINDASDHISTSTQWSSCRVKQRIQHSTNPPGVPSALDEDTVRGAEIVQELRQPVPPHKRLPVAPLSISYVPWKVVHCLQLVPLRGELSQLRRAIRRVTIAPGTPQDALVQIEGNGKTKHPQLVLRTVLARQSPTDTLVHGLRERRERRTIAYKDGSILRAHSAS